MKSLFFGLVLVTIFTNTFVKAQAPHAFKYQAVIRNSVGKVLVEKSIGIKISLVKDNINGSSVFSESFNVKTNKFGAINLDIGTGTVISGNFSTIDWGAGSYFIQIAVDENGETNYTVIGTSQLMSVPYALYAEKAGNSSFDGTWASLIGKPTLAAVATSGNYNDLTNLPSLFDGAWASLTDKPTLATVATSGSYNDLTNRPTKINTTLDNLATGTNPLAFNTTGSFNIAIGNSALANNISGNYNIATGTGALEYNTTGDNNIGIGYQALEVNITGSYNTATGMQALVNNFGSFNTAFGFNALTNNTTGINNTAIGYGADITVGSFSNATAIGYNAQVNASNNMVFGNSGVIGWGFGTVPGTAAVKVGINASNGNGATLTVGGVWTNASDSTKKYNIQPVNYGLKEVLKLRPVSYKMKGTGVQDIGFIAQEVKLVLPELVYGKEGEMTLSYGQITAVLTKAIQEQQNHISEQNVQLQDQKMQIQAQNEQIRELKAQMTELKAMCQQALKK
jgi:hypothetical protein